MKSHEGQKRSYGMKSHDDVGNKPFRKPAEAGAEAPGERIAKRLARAGIASRRDAEELIAAGRVKVNGQKLASPAFNVMPDDTIEVDGTAIPAIERTRLFLFHKPAGVVTTNRDPEGRKTVFDVLPADLPRLMTIGRLDINTEGLLLLTNDGGLSRVLELPATGWLRRYRVRVHGKVDEKALPGLKDGLAVDGVFYGSIEATLDREQGSNAWMTIGLREGKNREVKNILGALGLEVSRLIRISYGPFQLNDLPEGHVQEIKGKLLRDQLGERLIEEAGANFEAPVVNQFSNQPVKRAPEPRAEIAERPKIMRDGERGRIGEGGLIKNRKRRENTRDEALGKLSTSRPERPKFERGERPERPKFERGDKPARAAKFGDRPDRFATFAEKPGPKPRGGKKPEREQRPIEPPGQRKANVWMAPGARPIGAGRAAAEKAEVDAKRAAKKAYGKPGGSKPGFKPRGDRPGGGDGPPKGPRSGGKNADRRR
jgi:23S rRNA pseudouridine2605 synthase